MSLARKWTAGKGSGRRERNENKEKLGMLQEESSAEIVDLFHAGLREFLLFEQKPSNTDEAGLSAEIETHLVLCAVTPRNIS